MQLPNLKDKWPYLVVFVVALLGGSALGWGLKPDVVRIEEHLKTVEVEKQVVVVQEKVRVEIVKVKDTQVVERFRREKTVSPDGTMHEVEERNIEAVVKETENNVRVEVVKVDKEVVVERQVDRIIKVEPVLPNWHIGVLGGTELLTPVPVFGIAAERRIAGPFWGGVWGDVNTQFNRGQVGLKVSIEF
jgi:hypothetical protein